MLGERRLSSEDEKDDESGGAQKTRAQTPRADLQEIAIPSGESSHTEILAPRAVGRGAHAQADSRLRGSNNTMSPGAFEATMRLRPVAFAR